MAALPAKAISALYFAALGLGFIFFEITMIQRLVLLPRVPDVLADGDARVDPRVHRARRAAQQAARAGAGSMPACSWCSSRSRSFYDVRARPLTDSLLDQSLAVRVLVALLVLAPLGLCLGMFMPLGLGLVGG